MIHFNALLKVPTVMKTTNGLFKNGKIMNELKLVLENCFLTQHKKTKTSSIFNNHVTYLIDLLDSTNANWNLKSRLIQLYNRDYRAVFKWLAKNHCQINCSDQEPNRLLLRSITTRAKTSQNSSKLPVGKTAGTRFWFCFSYLKNWRESFMPISKRSNKNRPISIYSDARDWLPVLSTEARLQGMAYARVC